MSVSVSLVSRWLLTAREKEPDHLRLLGSVGLIVDQSEFSRTTTSAEDGSLTSEFRLNAILQVDYTGTGTDTGTH